MLISIMLEVFVFNCRALLTISAANTNLDVFWSGEGYIAIGNIGRSRYVYVGIEGSDDAQTEVSVPVTFSVFIQDEGNRDFYEIGEVTLLPAIEKSKYLKLHSYGEVTGIHIVPHEGSVSAMQVTKIIGDAKVPWFISPARIAAMFLILGLLFLLRPGSKLYEKRWTGRQERCGIVVSILLNVIVFAVLVRSNPAFINPVWSYHKQYQELAVSLSQGRVTINEGKEFWLQELEKMDNPYDTHLRRETVEGVDSVWDTCYYRGNFYVYFGIVPVLLFYLPYYLLFGSAFPTWTGVFLSACFAVSGVYYLLAKIRKRWFPKSSYVWYMILAVIMSNGMQLCCAMLRADFYYLPIITALAFSLWGIGFVFAATEDINRKGSMGKLALGAFLLAATAGCRPQFLVGSILILPVVSPVLFVSPKDRRGLGRLAAFFMPYVIVAACLMYYNYIRFSSFFDFGANYNLTTNDMTRRGFHIGRVPDGIFMYLFQAPNGKLVFPFAEMTGFYSDYLGETIRDWTYGGAFWTHMILLVLIGMLLLQKKMQDKGVLGFSVFSLVMGIVVVVADTEMAGILNRYYTDFLWLFLLPAMIVLFQLWENYKDTKWVRLLVIFVLVAGAGQIIYEFGIAICGSGIMNDNPYRYYMIKALFS